MRYRGTGAGGTEIGKRSRDGGGCGGTRTGGEAGVYRAEGGELVPVWPVTADGEYDEAYWNMHTVSLTGETLEIYKVKITEVRPDGIANEMITELERTVTLDEILAGTV